MSYPSTIDSYTAKTDAVDDVMAADVNELQTAIVSIETELGVNPGGTADDLVTRLAVSLDGDGNLALMDATTLTISSGAITAVQNYHRIETQSGASTDDLDTISGITDEGFVLIIRPVNAAHNVVIKHGTGNIACVGGIDITLDLTSDFALLLYDESLSEWLAMSSAIITSIATLSADNTWAGVNVFNRRIRYKYNAITTTTTLDDTYHLVTVDASGGAVTVNLPTAASIAGAEYNIKRINSGANAVTIDGNGSETIDGATTKVLTVQYQSITIYSNGANWLIK